MSEGMKLYRSFSKVLEDLGRIKLAWFTTFNLEISFFEKFILSRLAQRDVEEMRTIKDFEALNDILFTNEINNAKTDVRVFYDYRALSMRSSKKTCVQTIGINPSGFGKKFKDGVFHPKICLLINDRNEGVVITGSANLSLSGWARNVESILIKKIDDKENARRITNFFSSLIKDTYGYERMNKINRYWQDNLPRGSDWSFQDSFQPKGLLKNLSVKEKPLHVWSPYFSNNLIHVIEENLSQCPQINIVPDVNELGKVRIDEDVLGKLINNKKIELLKEIKYLDREKKPMVHAKVWLTKDKVAIGSWNFTEAGLNLGKSNNNIEAGIIQDISGQEYEKIIRSLSNSETQEKWIGMKRDELNEERNDELQNWKINVIIYADWEKFEYSIEQDTNLSGKQYSFSLPGIKKEIALRELINSHVSFYLNHKDLLKDRLFYVYDRKGEKIFMGIIVEKNITHRPAFGYDNLEDFIQAWLDGKPEENNKNIKHDYTCDEETGEEIQDAIKKKLAGDYSNAWFSMFLAMDQLKNRTEKAKDNVKELKLIGYYIPGSITQLRNHLYNLHEMYNDGKATSSAAYIWFLINEGNLVIKRFDMLRGNTGPKINLVENIELEFKNNSRKAKRWLKTIATECKY